MLNNKPSTTRKKRPRIELTSTSTFNDYCKATFDQDRGMFGNTSLLPWDKQLKFALAAGSEKWKESDRRFVSDSQKRRRGKKGWSKAHHRRKARENKRMQVVLDKDPEFKDPGPISDRKNWAEG